MFTVSVSGEGPLDSPGSVIKVKLAQQGPYEIHTSHENISRIWADLTLDLYSKLWVELNSIFVILCLIPAVNNCAIQSIFSGHQSW